MQYRTAHPLRRTAALITAGALTGIGLITVASPADAATRGCRSVQPGSGFYEAGLVASEMLTVPVSSRCTTISVKDITDPANPADHCATFKVGYFPAEAEAEYTDTVLACSTGGEVVLATAVPDGMPYRVFYKIDYLGQSLRYTIRH
jgi:hypothetical protein